MITKKCTHCKQEKDISLFHKNKRNLDGFHIECKICRKILMKKYYKNNKNIIKKRVNKYRNKNKEKINDNKLVSRKLYPWKRTLESIKQRCNNPNNEKYYRYGGRGIKCLITEQELKDLWFRDKAYLMKKPSIDRKDNNGNYEYGNCRYIELSENTKRRWKNNG